MPAEIRPMSASRIRLWPWAVCLLGCLSFVGCELAGCGLGRSDRTDVSTSSTSKDSKQPSPRQILNDMAAAYRQAPRYADSGELHIRAVKDGQQNDSQPIPFSVTLARPNKLRLHSFGASLVADGTKLQATVAQLGEQVLVRDAREKLSLKTILSDPLLAQSVRGQLEVNLPQLEVDLPQLQLLLAEQPLEALLGEANKPVRLKDRKLHGETCWRVKASGIDGDRVFWIDPETHLLRRFDFPTAQLRRTLDPEGALSTLRIWADFRGAQFAEKIADHAFEFETTASARLVKKFLPQPPQPPSPLVGQPAGDFSFVDVQGRRVDGKSLQGKVVVLEMWSLECAWCLAGLNAVYGQFKNDDRVEFLAVSTDAADVTKSQLQAELAKQGFKVPAARDPDLFARDLFQVQGLPTTIVIGADGTVQIYDPGYHAELAETLPGQLKSLLAGKNLAAETLEKHETERRAYEQQLAEAMVGTTTVVPLLQTQSADRTEPQSLVLEQLWTVAGLKSPGNLLVIPQADAADKILVLDGGNSVATIGVDGQLIDRASLDIPARSAVSFLRTAADAQGRRYFVAFAAAEQRLHLFDENWQRLLSFPDGSHPGIGDVQLADLDGDGQMKLFVGYWGTVGVQSVSLDGRRVWSNRTLENVLRMAPIGPDAENHSHLLCTSSRGTIVPIDFEGKQGDEIQVRGRPIHTIVAARPDENGPASLCAVSSTEATNTAVGISASGRELWHYDFPAGVYSRPVELVTAGRLFADGPGQWLIAGPDGSIHILSASGEPIDKFNTGLTLTGLATTLIDGQPILLVASTEGLTAWQVAPQR